MFEIIRTSAALQALFESDNMQIGAYYQGSRFNYIVRIEDDSITLIYNTLTNSFIAIGDEEFGMIKERFLLDKKSSARESIRSLVRLRMVVPENEDELATYKERFAFIQDLGRLSSGVVRYNIYTTTCCNARCFYCFEKGLPKGQMTLETADSVAKYVQNTYSRSADEIYFRWFGGEPLVNHEVISRICTFAREKGIPYFSTMSTNGLLLTRDLLCEKKTLWNLKKVRFSFDGVGEEHDRRKGVNGSFQKTMENMQAALDSGIRVLVRLTMDLNNAESLWRLAEMLVDRYKGCKDITFYPKCIFRCVSRDAFTAAPEKVIKLIRANDELAAHIIESGMFDYERLAPVGLRTYYCAANDPHKVVISPAGELCSCECNCVERECWGNVTEGITIDEKYKKWTVAPKVSEKCSCCPLLPTCTPFANVCPSDFFSCHARFETTMRLFMEENYRRFRAGYEMLRDTELFDKFQIV